jgi:hypothetical protein
VRNSAGCVATVEDVTPKLLFEADTVLNSAFTAVQSADPWLFKPKKSYFKLTITSAARAQYSEVHFLTGFQIHSR